MAFSPNQVAAPNAAEGASGAWQHQIVCDAGGGTLYVLLDDNIGDFVLYVTTDDMATGSLLNSTCPINPIRNYEAYLQLIGGKLRLTTVLSNDGTARIVQFTEYDITLDSWSAVTNIEGGLYQNQDGPLTAAQQCAGLYRFLRQDGTSIVCYQRLIFTSGVLSWQVHILKEDSGSWTTIGSFVGSPTDDPYYVLYSCGLNPVTDRIYGFMNHISVVGGGGPSNYTATEMMAFVVDTDDTITSSVIESGPDYEEEMPFDAAVYGTSNCVGGLPQPIDSSENGRVAFSADGMEVAYIWGFWTNSHLCAEIPTTAIHIGIGDLSGDPVNPSWSIEIAAASNPINWNNGFSNDCSVTYVDEPAIFLEAFGDNDGGGNKVWCLWGRHTGAGAGLKAYWGSKTNASDFHTQKLYWSRRTAANTWSAKAILWPDPDRDTIHMDGFDIPPPFPETPPPSLTLACPVGGGTATIGVPYSAFLVVGGDYTPPLFFEIIAGALPDGLTLNSATGEISGTPFGSGGTFQTSYQVTDSGSPPQVATT